MIKPTYFARYAFLACALVGSEPASAIIIADNRPDYTAIVPNDVSNPLSGVGYLLSPFPTGNTGSACSGAAISSRVVLTAAHCFNGTQNKGTFSIAYDNGVTVSDAYSSVVIHPSYTGATTSAGDIALAFLKSPLPSFVQIYGITNFVTAPIGAAVTLIGYGNHGTGSTGQIPHTNSSTEKRFGYNTVESTFNGGAGFSVDFDPPSGCVPKFGCSSLFGNAESITAQGDSGSPVLYNPYVDLNAYYSRLPKGTQVKPEPDVYSILGVTSYGSYANGQTLGQYGTSAGYTFAGYYKDWIESYVSNLQVVTIQAPILSSAGSSVDVSALVELPPSTAGLATVPLPPSLLSLGLALTITALASGSQVFRKGVLGQNA